MGIWIGKLPDDDDNLTAPQAQVQLMAVERIIEEPRPVADFDPVVVAELERHGLVENGGDVVKPTAAAIHYARLIEAT